MRGFTVSGFHDRLERSLLSGVLAVANARSLAREIAQVEEASATDDTARNNLDLVDTGRMRQEDALDTNIEAHLTNGEGAAGTRTVALQDNTLENLNTVLVAFGNLVVHANRVADTEVGDVRAQLRGFHLGEYGRGVHVLEIRLGLPRACGKVAQSTTRASLCQGRCFRLNSYGRGTSFRARHTSGSVQTLENTEEHGLALPWTDRTKSQGHRTMAFALTSERETELKSILSRYPNKMAACIPVLHLCQDQNGWVSDDVILYVAATLDLPAAHVKGVVTFYSLFNQEPVGKHQVWVCRTLPCALRGADDVLKHCEKRLGIHAGQTTKDGKITLRTAECLASCGTAPMIQVDKDYHENLTLARVDEILNRLGA